MMRYESSMMANSLLSASMSVNASQASVGDLLSYTATFTNNSTSVLTCMFARINIDMDLEVEAGSIGVNNVAIANQSLELIPLPNLAPGATNTIDFNAFIVRQVGLPGCPITVNATVNFVNQGQGCRVTTNDTLTQIIPTTPVQNLYLLAQKCVDKKEAVVGEVLCYTIKLKSQAYANISNIVLTDVLDPNLVLVPNSLTVNGYPVQGSLSGLQLPNLFYTDCYRVPELCISYSALIISKPVTLSAVIDNEAVITYTVGSVGYTVTTNTVVTEIPSKVKTYNEMLEINLLGNTTNGVQFVTDVAITNVVITPVTQNVMMYSTNLYVVSFTVTLTYIDYQGNVAQYVSQQSVNISSSLNLGAAFVYVVSCQSPIVCNPYYIQVPISILVEA